MNSYFKKDLKDGVIIISIIFCILFICVCLVLGIVDLDKNVKQNKLQETESQFGGAVSMEIYQVYDRDTGVYYAVTEKGGICVMYTMEGKIKLVDEGDGAIHHPNKGETNEVSNE